MSLIKLTFLVLIAIAIFDSYSVAEPAHRTIQQRNIGIIANKKKIHNHGQNLRTLRKNKKHIFYYKPRIYRAKKKKYLPRHGKKRNFITNKNIYPSSLHTKVTRNGEPTTSQNILILAGGRPPYRKSELSVHAPLKPVLKSQNEFSRKQIKVPKKHKRRSGLIPPVSVNPQISIKTILPGTVPKLPVHGISQYLHDRQTQGPVNVKPKSSVVSQISDSQKLNQQVRIHHRSVEDINEQEMASSTKYKLTSKGRTKRKPIANRLSKAQSKLPASKNPNGKGSQLLYDAQQNLPVNKILQKPQEPVNKKAKFYTMLHISDAQAQQSVKTLKQQGRENHRLVQNLHQQESGKKSNYKQTRQQKLKATGTGSIKFKVITHFVKSVAGSQSKLPTSKNEQVRNDVNVQQPKLSANRTQGLANSVTKQSKKESNRRVSNRSVKNMKQMEISTTSKLSGNDNNKQKETGNGSKKSKQLNAKIRSVINSSVNLQFRNIVKLKTLAASAQKVAVKAKLQRHRGLKPQTPANAKKNLFAKSQISSSITQHSLQKSNQHINEYLRSVPEMNQYMKKPDKSKLSETGFTKSKQKDNGSKKIKGTDNDSTKPKSVATKQSGFANPQGQDAVKAQALVGSQSKLTLREKQNVQRALKSQVQSNSNRQSPEVSVKVKKYQRSVHDMNDKKITTSIKSKLTDNASKQSKPSGNEILLAPVHSQPKLPSQSVGSKRLQARDIGSRTQKPIVNKISPVRIYSQFAIGIKTSVGAQSNLQVFRNSKVLNHVKSHLIRSSQPKLSEKQKARNQRGLKQHRLPNKKPKPSVNSQISTSLNQPIRELYHVVQNIKQQKTVINRGPNAMGNRITKTKLTGNAVSPAFKNSQLTTAKAQKLAGIQSKLSVNEKLKNRKTRETSAMKQQRANELSRKHSTVSQISDYLTQKSRQILNQQEMSIRIKSKHTRNGSNQNKPIVNGSTKPKSQGIGYSQINGKSQRQDSKKNNSSTNSKISVSLKEQSLKKHHDVQQKKKEQKMSMIQSHHQSKEPPHTKAKHYVVTQFSNTLKQHSVEKLSQHSVDKLNEHSVDNLNAKQDEYRQSLQKLNHQKKEIRKKWKPKPGNRIAIGHSHVNKEGQQRRAIKSERQVGKKEKGSENSQTLNHKPTGNVKPKSTRKQISVASVHSHINEKALSQYVLNLKGRASTKAKPFVSNSQKHQAVNPYQQIKQYRRILQKLSQQKIHITKKSKSASSGSIKPIPRGNRISGTIGQLETDKEVQLQRTLKSHGQALTKEKLSENSHILDSFKQKSVQSQKQKVNDYYHASTYRHKQEISMRKKSKLKGIGSTNSKSKDTGIIKKSNKKASNEISSAAVHTQVRRKVYHQHALKYRERANTITKLSGTLEMSTSRKQQSAHHIQQLLMEYRTAKVLNRKEKTTRIKSKTKMNGSTKPKPTDTSPMTSYSQLYGKVRDQAVLTQQGAASTKTTHFAGWQHKISLKQKSTQKIKQHLMEYYQASRDINQQDMTFRTKSKRLSNKRAIALQHSQINGKRYSKRAFKTEGKGNTIAKPSVFSHTATSLEQHPIQNIKQQLKEYHHIEQDLKQANLVISKKSKRSDNANVTLKPSGSGISQIFEKVKGHHALQNQRVASRKTKHTTVLQNSNSFHHQSALNLKKLVKEYKEALQKLHQQKSLIATKYELRHNGISSVRTHSLRNRNIYGQHALKSHTRTNTKPTFSVAAETSNSLKYKEAIQIKQQLKEFQHAEQELKKQEISIKRKSNLLKHSQTNIAPQGLRALKHRGIASTLKKRSAVSQISNVLRHQSVQNIKQQILKYQHTAQDLNRRDMSVIKKSIAIGSGKEYSHMHEKAYGYRNVQRHRENNTKTKLSAGSQVSTSLNYQSTQTSKEQLREYYQTKKELRPQHKRNRRKSKVASNAKGNAKATGAEFSAAPVHSQIYEKLQNKHARKHQRTASKKMKLSAVSQLSTSIKQQSVQNLNQLLREYQQTLLKLNQQHSSIKNKSGLTRNGESRIQQHSLINRNVYGKHALKYYGTASTNRKLSAHSEVSTSRKHKSTQSIKHQLKQYNQAENDLNIQTEIVTKTKLTGNGIQHSEINGKVYGRRTLKAQTTGSRKTNSLTQQSAQNIKQQLTKYYQTEEDLSQQHIQIIKNSKVRANADAKSKATVSGILAAPVLPLLNRKEQGRRTIKHEKATSTITKLSELSHTSASFKHPATQNLEELVKQYHRVLKKLKQQQSSIKTKSKLTNNDIPRMREISLINKKGYNHHALNSKRRESTNKKLSAVSEISTSFKHESAQKHNQLVKEYQKTMHKLNKQETKTKSILMGNGISLAQKHSVITGESYSRHALESQEIAKTEAKLSAASQVSTSLRHQSAYNIKQQLREYYQTEEELSKHHKTNESKSRKTNNANANSKSTASRRYGRHALESQEIANTEAKLSADSQVSTSLRHQSADNIKQHLSEYFQTEEQLSKHHKTNESKSRKTNNANANSKSTASRRYGRHALESQEISNTEAKLSADSQVSTSLRHQSADNIKQHLSEYYQTEEELSKHHKTNESKSRKTNNANANSKSTASRRYGRHALESQEIANTEAKLSADSQVSTSLRHQSADNIKQHLSEYFQTEEQLSKHHKTNESKSRKTNNANANSKLTASRRYGRHALESQEIANTEAKFSAASQVSTSLRHQSADNIKQHLSKYYQTEEELSKHHKTNQGKSRKTNNVKANSKSTASRRYGRHALESQEISNTEAKLSADSQVSTFLRHQYAHNIKQHLSEYYQTEEELSKHHKTNKSKSIKANNANAKSKTTAIRRYGQHALESQETTNTEAKLSAASQVSTSLRHQSAHNMKQQLREYYQTEEELSKENSTNKSRSKDTSKVNAKSKSTASRISPDPLHSLINGKVQGQHTIKYRRKTRKIRKLSKVSQIAASLSDQTTQNLKTLLNEYQQALLKIKQSAIKSNTKLTRNGRTRAEEHSLINKKGNSLHALKSKRRESRNTKPSAVSEISTSVKHESAQNLNQLVRQFQNNMQKLKKQETKTKYTVMGNGISLAKRHSVITGKSYKQRALDSQKIANTEGNVSAASHVSTSLRSQSAHNMKQQLREYYQTEEGLRKHHITNKSKYRKTDNAKAKSSLIARGISPPQLNPQIYGKVQSQGARKHQRTASTINKFSAVLQIARKHKTPQNLNQLVKEYQEALQKLNQQQSSIKSNSQLTYNGISEAREYSLINKKMYNQHDLKSKLSTVSKVSSSLNHQTAQTIKRQLWQHNQAEEDGSQQEMIIKRKSKLTGNGNENSQNNGESYGQRGLKVHKAGIRNYSAFSRLSNSLRHQSVHNIKQQLKEYYQTEEHLSQHHITINTKSKVTDNANAKSKLIAREISPAQLHSQIYRTVQSQGARKLQRIVSTINKLSAVSKITRKHKTIQHVNQLVKEYQEALQKINQQQSSTKSNSQLTRNGISGAREHSLINEKIYNQHDLKSKLSTVSEVSSSLNHQTAQSIKRQLWQHNQAEQERNLQEMLTKRKSKLTGNGIENSENIGESYGRRGLKVQRMGNTKTSYSAFSRLSNSLRHQSAHHIKQQLKEYDQTEEDLSQQHITMNTKSKVTYNANAKSKLARGKVQGQRSRKQQRTASTINERSAVSGIARKYKTPQNLNQLVKEYQEVLQKLNQQQSSTNSNSQLTRNGISGAREHSLINKKIYSQHNLKSKLSTVSEVSSSLNHQTAQSTKRQLWKHNQGEQDQRVKEYQEALQKLNQQQSSIKSNSQLTRNRISRAREHSLINKKIYNQHDLKSKLSTVSEVSSLNHQTAQSIKRQLWQHNQAEQDQRVKEYQEALQTLNQQQSSIKSNSKLPRNGISGAREQSLINKQIYSQHHLKSKLSTVSEVLSSHQTAQSRKRQLSEHNQAEQDGTHQEMIIKRKSKLTGNGIENSQNNGESYGHRSLKVHKGGITNYSAFSRLSNSLRHQSAQNIKQQLKEYDQTEEDLSQQHITINTNTKVPDNANSKSKLIARGISPARLHSQIYGKVQSQGARKHQRIVSTINKLSAVSVIARKHKTVQNLNQLVKEYQEVLQKLNQQQSSTKSNSQLRRNGISGAREHSLINEKIYNQHDLKSKLSTVSEVSSSLNHQTAQSIKRQLWQHNQAEQERNLQEMLTRRKSKLTGNGMENSENIGESYGRRGLKVQRMGNTKTSYSAFSRLSNSLRHQSAHHIKQQLKEYDQTEEDLSQQHITMNTKSKVTYNANAKSKLARGKVQGQRSRKQQRTASTINERSAVSGIARKYKTPQNLNQLVKEYQVVLQKLNQQQSSTKSNSQLTRNGISGAREHSLINEKIYNQHDLKSKLSTVSEVSSSLNHQTAQSIKRQLWQHNQAEQERNLQEMLTKRKSKFTSDEIKELENHSKVYGQRVLKAQRAGSTKTSYSAFSRLSNSLRHQSAHHIKQQLKEYDQTEEDLSQQHITMNTKSKVTDNTNAKSILIAREISPAQLHSQIYGKVQSQGARKHQRIVSTINKLSAVSVIARKHKTVQNLNQLVKEYQEVLQKLNQQQSSTKSNSQLTRNGISGAREHSLINEKIYNQHDLKSKLSTVSEVSSSFNHHTAQGIKRQFWQHNQGEQERNQQEMLTKRKSKFTIDEIKELENNSKAYAQRVLKAQRARSTKTSYSAFPRPSNLLRHQSAHHIKHQLKEYDQSEEYLSQQHITINTKSKVIDNANAKSKLIARGISRARLHSKIYGKVQSQRSRKHQRTANTITKLSAVSEITRKYKTPQNLNQLVKEYQKVLQKLNQQQSSTKSNSQLTRNGISGAREHSLINEKIYNQHDLKSKLSTVSEVSSSLNHQTAQSIKRQLWQHNQAEQERNLQEMLTKRKSKLTGNGIENSENIGESYGRRGLKVQRMGNTKTSYSAFSRLSNSLRHQSAHHIKQQLKEYDQTEEDLSQQHITMNTKSKVTYNANAKSKLARGKVQGQRSRKQQRTASTINERSAVSGIARKYKTPQNLNQLVKEYQEVLQKLNQQQSSTNSNSQLTRNGISGAREHSLINEKIYNQHDLKSKLSTVSEVSSSLNHQTAQSIKRQLWQHNQAEQERNLQEMLTKRKSKLTGNGIENSENIGESYGRRGLKVQRMGNTKTSYSAFSRLSNSLRHQSVHHIKQQLKEYDQTEEDLSQQHITMNTKSKVTYNANAKSKLARGKVQGQRSRKHQRTASAINERSAVSGIARKHRTPQNLNQLVKEYQEALQKLNQQQSSIKSNSQLTRNGISGPREHSLINKKIYNQHDMKSKLSTVSEVSSPLYHHTAQSIKRQLWQHNQSEQDQRINEYQEALQKPKQQQSSIKSNSKLTRNGISEAREHSRINTKIYNEHDMKSKLSTVSEVSSSLNHQTAQSSKRQFWKHNQGEQERNQQEMLTKRKSKLTGNGIENSENIGESYGRRGLKVQRMGNTKTSYFAFSPLSNSLRHQSAHHIKQQLNEYDQTKEDLSQQHITINTKSKVTDNANAKSKLIGRGISRARVHSQIYGKVPGQRSRKHQRTASAITKLSAVSEITRKHKTLQNLNQLVKEYQEALQKLNQQQSSIKSNSKLTRNGISEAREPSQINKKIYNEHDMKSKISTVSEVSSPLYHQTAQSIKRQLWQHNQAEQERNLQEMLTKRKSKLTGNGIENSENIGESYGRRGLKVQRMGNTKTSYSAFSRLSNSLRHQSAHHIKQPLKEYDQTEEDLSQQHITMNTKSKVTYNANAKSKLARGKVQGQRSRKQQRTASTINERSAVSGIARKHRTPQNLNQLVKEYQEALQKLNQQQSSIKSNSQLTRHGISGPREHSVINNFYNQHDMKSKLSQLTSNEISRAREHLLINKKIYNPHEPKSKLSTVSSSLNHQTAQSIKRQLWQHNQAEQDQQVKEYQEALQKLSQQQSSIKSNSQLTRNRISRAREHSLINKKIYNQHDLKSKISTVSEVSSALNHQTAQSIKRQLWQHNQAEQDQRVKEYQEALQKLSQQQSTIKSNSQLTHNGISRAREHLLIDKKIYNQHDLKSKLSTVSEVSSSLNYQTAQSSKRQFWKHNQGEQERNQQEMLTKRKSKLTGNGIENSENIGKSYGRRGLKAQRTGSTKTSYSAFSRLSSSLRHQSAHNIGEQVKKYYQTEEDLSQQHITSNTNSKVTDNANAKSNLIARGISPAWVHSQIYGKIQGQRARKHQRTASTITKLFAVSQIAGKNKTPQSLNELLKEYQEALQKLNQQQSSIKSNSKLIRSGISGVREYSLINKKVYSKEDLKSQETGSKKSKLSAVSEVSTSMSHQAAYIKKRFKEYYQAEKDVDQNELSFEKKSKLTSNGILSDSDHSHIYRVVQGQRALKHKGATSLKHQSAQNLKQVVKEYQQELKKLNHEESSVKTKSKLTENGISSNREHNGKRYGQRAWKHQGPTSTIAKVSAVSQISTYLKQQSAQHLNKFEQKFHRELQKLNHKKTAIKIESNTARNRIQHSKYNTKQYNKRPLKSQGTETLPEISQFSNSLKLRSTQNINQQVKEYQEALQKINQRQMSIKRKSKLRTNGISPMLADSLINGKGFGLRVLKSQATTTLKANLSAVTGTSTSSKQHSVQNMKQLQEYYKAGQVLNQQEMKSNTKYKITDKGILPAPGHLQSYRKTQGMRAMNHKETASTKTNISEVSQFSNSFRQQYAQNINQLVKEEALQNINLQKKSVKAISKINRSKINSALEQRLINKNAYGQRHRNPQGTSHTKVSPLKEQSAQNVKQQLRDYYQTEQELKQQKMDIRTKSLPTGNFRTKPKPTGNKILPVQGQRAPIHRGTKSTIGNLFRATSLETSLKKHSALNFNQLGKQYQEPLQKLNKQEMSIKTNSKIIANKISRAEEHVHRTEKGIATKRAKLSAGSQLSTSLKQQFAENTKHHLKQYHHAEHSVTQQQYHHSEQDIIKQISTSLKQKSVQARHKPLNGYEELQGLNQKSISIKTKYNAEAYNKLGIKSQGINSTKLKRSAFSKVKKTASSLQQQSTQNHHQLAKQNKKIREHQRTVENLNYQSLKIRTTSKSTGSNRVEHKLIRSIFPSTDRVQNQLDRAQNSTNTKEHEMEYLNQNVKEYHESVHNWNQKEMASSTIFKRKYNGNIKPNGIAHLKPRSQSQIPAYLKLQAEQHLKQEVLEHRNRKQHYHRNQQEMVIRTKSKRIGNSNSKHKVKGKVISPVLPSYPIIPVAVTSQPAGPGTKLSISAHQYIPPILTGSRPKSSEVLPTVANLKFPHADFKKATDYRVAQDYKTPPYGAPLPYGTPSFWRASYYGLLKEMLQHKLLFKRNCPADVKTVNIYM